MTGSRFASLRASVMAGVLGTLLYEAPYFVLGPRASLVISDNLEPNVAVISQWFGKGYSAPLGEARVLPFILDGLPGVAASPEVDGSGFYFALLSTYWAYVAIDLTSRIVGLVGMLFLLRRIRFVPAPVALLSALCFALTPHWTPGFLSVTGMPLVVLALWVCKERDEGVDVPVRSRGLALAALATYPFFSSLPLAGMFVAAAVGLWWLVLAVKNRRVCGWTLGGVLLIVAGIAITNRGLLLETALRHDYVWQRVEFRPLVVKAARTVLGEALYEVRAGQPTAPTGAFPFAFILFALFALASRTWRRDGTFPGERRIFWRTLAGAALYVTFATIIGALLPVVPALRQVGLTRVSVFFPLVTYVLLAICGGALWQGPRWQRNATVAVLGFQLLRQGYRSEWITARHTPSFVSFTAPAAFDQIERVIGRPRTDVRVACLGFPPSVAHFNGYRTVDGYWYLYPLEYKHRFRRAIAGELDKSADLKAYFDDYGSRAYIFSSELWQTLPDRFTFLASRDKRVTRIENLALDTSALGDLGASFLLSAVEVGNAADLHLELLEKIQDPTAAMDLYVYRLPVR